MAAFSTGTSTIRSKRRAAYRTKPSLKKPSPVVLAFSGTLSVEIPEDFQGLFQKADYKVYYGGRGSAKSWSVARVLVLRAVSEKFRILCAREYQNSINDSVYVVLRDQVFLMGLTPYFEFKRDSIICKLTGATFAFKGLHANIAEIKSYEGVDLCWVEEAQRVSKESWEILIPTIRKEGSEIWVTFNPMDEDDPTYQQFVVNRRPNSIVRKVNYYHNPYFTDKLKREMEYMRGNDFAAYRHIWLGYTRKISNSLVLWDRVSIETFPEDLWKSAPRLHYGLDFGFAQDPTVLIRQFVYDNTLYVEYEAYGIGVDFEGNKAKDGTNRGELEQLLDTVPGARDWPIKADNARPETISFLRGKGYAVTAAEKWKGSVEDGIAHLRGFKKIIIHERCKHAAQEARLYSFKRDVKTGEVLPIIIDKHNNCWDACRYGLDGYIQRRGDAGIWSRLAG
ncbi:MAG: PBSX family phage terminase large subunit [Ktedonobacterales bacterium]